MPAFVALLCPHFACSHKTGSPLQYVCIKGQHFVLGRDCTMTKDPAAIVGARIRAIRKQNAMTQEEFSESLEIAPKYLGMFERGERMLSSNIAYRIQDMYGVSTDELFHGPSLVSESGFPRNPESLRGRLLQLVETCSEEEAAACLPAVRTILQAIRAVRPPSRTGEAHNRQP